MRKDEKVKAKHTLLAYLYDIPELRLSDCTLICRIDDIAKVDSSFFSFKPFNGFLVTFKTSYPTAWAPGLVVGKRGGVGDLTQGAVDRVI